MGFHFCGTHSHTHTCLLSLAFSHSRASVVQAQHELAFSHSQPRLQPHAVGVHEAVAELLDRDGLAGLLLYRLLSGCLRRHGLHAGLLRWLRWLTSLAHFAGSLRWTKCLRILIIFTQSPRPSWFSMTKCRTVIIFMFLDAQRMKIQDFYENHRLRQGRGRGGTDKHTDTVMALISCNNIYICIEMMHFI